MVRLSPLMLMIVTGCSPEYGKGVTLPVCITHCTTTTSNSTSTTETRATAVPGKTSEPGPEQWPSK